MGFYMQDCFWEAVEDEPVSVQKEVVWAAAKTYFTGDPPLLKGHSKSIFASMRDRILQAKDAAMRKKQSRGTNAVTNNGTNQVTNDVTDYGTNAVTNNGTKTSLALIERERERKREKNTHPSAPEVLDYALSLGYDWDLQEAESLVDYYDDNGWTRGRNRTPIKDWHRTVVNWERNRKGFSNSRKGAFDAGSSEYADAI